MLNEKLLPTVHAVKIIDLEGDPGNISCYQGHLGGISYGLYKFASSIGVPQSFVGWLNQKGHPYGRMLSKFAAGTREFSCCWQYLGEHDPNEFKLLQHEFVKASYFVPTVEHLKKEFSLDIENSGSERLKEIVWLMSIEFGPYKTIELLRKIQASKLLPPERICQLEEPRLIEHINDLLSTKEWLEAKEQLVSGLSPFLGGREYIKNDKMKQFSA